MNEVNVSVQQQCRCVDLPLEDMPKIQPGTIETFAVGFKSWKHDFIRRYYPERCVHFLPAFPSKRETSCWQERLISTEDAELLVWGPTCPSAIKQLADQNGIPILYMEDGFLRSKRKNSSRTAPLSLTVDRQRAYFDCRGPSDLEDLLNNTHFDPALLERARQAIDVIVNASLTKYNGTGEALPERISADGKRRVLVVGQVEQDASISLWPSAANEEQ